MPQIILKMNSDLNVFSQLTHNFRAQWDTLLLLFVKICFQVPPPLFLLVSFFNFSLIDFFILFFKLFFLNLDFVRFFTLCIPRVGQNSQDESDVGQEGKDEEHTEQHNPDQVTGVPLILNIHSLMYSVIDSSFHTFVYLFILLLIYPFILSLFIFSIINLSFHTFVYLFILLLIYPFILSFICLFYY